MRAKATIRLKFPSAAHLETVKASLSPEVNKPSSGRARMVMESDGFFLVLKVEADDTVALRSTLNSYLRWISSTVNVIQVLDQQT